MFGCEKARQPSEPHDLIALDVTAAGDRGGHPRRHPREGARGVAQLIGGVLVEVAGDHLEGAIGQSHA
jgi:hypothetical protein